MANYRYQVRTASGALQTGVLASDSVATAATVLRNQGLHVLSLSPTAGGVDGEGFLQRIKDLNGGNPTQKNVLDFTTQLAVMIRAGINLRAALDGIAEQTAHPKFKKIITQIKTDVEGGKQLSDALAKYPKLFGPLYVNMVRASEMAGNFSKMLERIAGYIGQQIETRKMVVGAAIYPTVIGVFAVAVTVFLLAFVLPKFYAVFEGKEDVLPWATKFLMSLSKFMVAQWPFLLGGIVVLAGAGYAFTRTELGAFWVDRLKLSVPLIRTMFRALYISRSLQTMGQLVNAGVPLLDTLAITGDISGNQLYKGMWRRVYTAVKQGKKICTPLQKDNMLPRAVTQMISAGEESGKLGEVLDEISAYYAKQLKDAIKAVTGMIEPVMILLMGTVVGFIAMAIILPIFKMSQIVK
ncbi:MAG: type II secretion system F family protein [Phycisphaeraceae bacterium]|nr:MAG: type II secretion system F family protein [Phycisphaeraceae bacterium]